MFLLVVGGGLALLHIYIWKRLVRDTTSPGLVRRVAAVALILLVAFMIAAFVFGTRSDPAVAQWFAWPGYLWLALFYYLMLATLVLEVPRLFLRKWAKSEEPIAGVSRRVFLARGTAAIAGAAAVGIVGYGTSVAMGGPTVSQVPITLRRLDPRASGFRIALISDVHLGPLLGRSFTQRVVDLVNEQRPDAVAIVGDLVDGTVEHLAEAAEPLRELRSTHGTFFVTGNHEYYSGYTEWVDHVPTLGIRPLRNERVPITHNGGTFDLAGVNDATAYQWQDDADVGKALQGRDPSRAVVLLAHQPVDVADAVAHDVDLQLSGHTHGGQITPFELLVSLQQGAVAGLSQHGNTQLYVTRGAGFWGPPVRVGAPPDVTIVELRAL
ncbi:metallophosphoesterase [Amycolatopsis sp. 195334CR]|uniref:metallophosphoesterase n=1 Tax=Amycolatopsis sp. 195334CR TaxID=2814588 RepID=UPI001A902BE2|nr:metallophosphoesterase [Amycolatopsis sp. 195334CR]MBN6036019.1 metallophosphoesterase [Amycolatopsis sp. 195334CR]